MWRLSFGAGPISGSFKSAPAAARVEPPEMGPGSPGTPVHPEITN